MPVPVEARVGFVPKYELIAAEVKALADGGAESVGITTAVGETYDTVRAALHFARTGERPATRPPGRRTGNRTGPPKYLTLATEVSRLRDEEHLPFTQIARRLGMGEATARRAYDLAHKAEVTDAVSDGQRPDRGRYVLVSVEKRREIAERLGRGEPVRSIAAAVGCSENTIRRIRRGANG